MHIDFWHERWHRGETGWHLDCANPLLERHWPQLDIPTGARVLVPLCGKSQDLVWFASHGYQVIGVELSAVAVEAFFAEHSWTPELIETHDTQLFRAGNIDIICSDFLALDPLSLGHIDAVYDRGALVALPDDMRERYVSHLRTVTPVPATTLLITLDYQQDQMSGPPFSVSQEEVVRLFGGTHAIEVLSIGDALIGSPHLRNRGVTAMTETAIALTPTSAQELQTCS